MESNEIFYTPINQNWDIAILVFTIVALMSIASLAYFMFRPSSSLSTKLSSVFKTVVFLALVAAIIVTVFIWFNYSKTERIVLTSDSITTPFGHCNYDEIKKIELKDRKKAKTDKPEANDKSLYLIIEEYSGHTHVLREAHYDIIAIKNDLDSRMNQKLKIGG